MVNVMKLPILLTALLLSTSPALADDYLYMVCKVKGRNTITNLTSGHAQDKKDVEDYVMFKVDLSRVCSGTIGIQNGIVSA